MSEIIFLPKRGQPTRQGMGVDLFVLAYGLQRGAGLYFTQTISHTIFVPSLYTSSWTSNQRRDEEVLIVNDGGGLRLRRTWYKNFGIQELTPGAGDASRI